MFKILRKLPRKIVWFAVLGAAGGATAAILAEIWLWTVQSRAPRTAICMLLDCSGSMSFGKLDEMKLAANDFVSRHMGEGQSISVVRFDSDAEVICPSTADIDEAQKALSSLQLGGSTNMAAGITVAKATFPPDISRKFVLIFTDGMPDDQSLAKSAAADCGQADISLVAVGTGDADVGYLEQLTGDPKLVFPATAGSFAQAFGRAGAAIHDMLGSGVAVSGSGVALLRVGVWTALLAVGIALALVAAQNSYLGKVAISPAELRSTAGIGILAGLLAGGIGQLLYSFAGGGNILVQESGRILGWTVMGLLIGAGLSRAVPNLMLRRGAAGGMAGGAIGVIAFILISTIAADSPGRIIGATILGLCIGAMIALLESVLREAWLEVRYAGGETRTISLGRTPVTFGSDSTRCTIFVPSVAPVALSYTLLDGRALCEDISASQSENIHPDESRRLGNISITMKAATASPSQSSRAATGGGFAGNARSSNLEQPLKKNQSASPRGFTTTSSALNLVIRGRNLSLKNGARFRAAEIPGIEPAEADGTVAEVVSNPNDPSLLGLKNTSRTLWSATTPDGRQIKVENGKSLKLAAGTKVQFGLTEGTILQA